MCNGTEIGCQNRSKELLSIKIPLRELSLVLVWKRVALSKGSQVMDEIIWSEEAGYTRHLIILVWFWRAEPILVRGVMKPIPTSLQTHDECGY